MSAGADGSGSEAASRGGTGRGAELRAQLEAAGALLGVPLIVTDDAEWSVDEWGTGERGSDGRGAGERGAGERGAGERSAAGSGAAPSGRERSGAGVLSLRVGLGWYAARGHGDAEAVALAMLQLWEAVRGELVAPSRARRRRTLSRSMPWAEPLVGAVLRLQAAAELLTALPAFRGPLAAAMHRSLPGGIGGGSAEGAGEPATTGTAAFDELPRHLQWVLLILRAGIGSGGEPIVAEPDPAVREEWLTLVERASPERERDPLRRVLAPDPARTPLQRFERALALLLPAYERLLALDAVETGLASAGRAEGSDGPGESLGLEGAGSGAEEGEEGAAEDPETQDAGADSTPESGESERARAGDREDTAEGADLFAAEHAAFVSAILPTPMPAEGALFEATMDLSEQSSRGRAESTAAALGAAGATAAAGTTALAAYRERAEALAAPIEAMRELWTRVIAERVARRRSRGRLPTPEGDELAVEALAEAVAESLAGASRPNAYLQRREIRRRARRAGSTDYALLIDRSASMSGPAAEAAADAALIMLEALAGVERDVAHAESLTGTPLELDIRTALIVFDAEAHVVKPLSGGLDDGVRRALHAAIRAPRGATNDGAALAAASAQFGVSGRGGRGGSGAAAGAGAAGAGAAGTSTAGTGAAETSTAGIERRRIAILLSDGGTNDPIAAAHELRRLRRAGVRVHGVGIGSDEIVQRYAPTSRRLDDPREIAEALQQLVEDELP